MRLPKKFPVATLVVLVITGIITSMQLVYPWLLPLLERSPGAISRHEYWRLFTPMFVHSGGWRQICFNFPAIAIVGWAVEYIYGRYLWLLVYFASGLLGEIVGYAWQPHGAGASVAGAGLLGALAAWLLFANRRPGGIFGGLLLLAGAIVLVVMRDIHGPPVLLGACIALAAAGRSRKTILQARRQQLKIYTT